ncbi:MAG: 2-dehydropantoate 2-reductase, partial [Candidatus Eremiobacteraeota bacterium]|nr:2-dehydropantoate 2-reductase [Candidatus Eremiobacteraeota bacterium]
VGAGALGLTFAAALATTHDVIVLARRADVADTLTHDGVTVDDANGTRRVRLHASADPRALAECDAVLVAVKAYATVDALAPLRGALGANALIASVQNGLDAAADARTALPGARVIAGSTTQGAIRLTATHVQRVNNGTTIFARNNSPRHPEPPPRHPELVEGSSSPTSDDLVAAFTAAGLDAHVTDDIATILWRKLIVNAAINPLGALARATNGAIATDPDLVPLARGLAAEAAAVAAAEGIEPGDPWALVEGVALTAAANRNSMLQDLDAGRPTEIEAISGAIARRAHRYGIAVPLTETVLRLVRARERAR